MVHEGPLSWKVNKDKTIGRCGLSQNSPLTKLKLEMLSTGDIMENMILYHYQMVIYLKIS